MSIEIYLQSQLLFIFLSNCFAFFIKKQLKKNDFLLKSIYQGLE